MMLTLIRKEWRLNRAILVGCLVTLLMPYLLSAANLWISPPRGPNVDPRDYVDAVKFAAFASLVITVIFAAAFGGQSFAGERRERTAEFLAMLPVSRGAIIASKLVVPAACLAALIVLHVLVLLVCDDWALRIGLSRRDGADILYSSMFTVGYVLEFFGMAWALSVSLRSAALAAVITIGIGIAMFFGMLAWAERLSQFFLRRFGNMAEGETMTIAAISVMVAAIGIAAIVSSSVYYRRRVEP